MPMLKSYYQNPHVCRRIREFLGAERTGGISCRYLATGTASDTHWQLRPTEELSTCLTAGLDISRSLWDRDSLIADLDIEYVNFDRPADVYLYPEPAFELQAPVVRAVEALLADVGITPLHLLSGRGHHFVWRIRRESRVFRRLVRLGHASAALASINSRPHPPTGESVSGDLGAAFAGLGLVMEFLGHRIKELGARASEIPVELTALEVGPSPRGREMVSVDISEYGDPLHVRTIRAPFSVYLKPRQQRWLFANGEASQLPPLFLVPLHEMSVSEGLRVMRDPVATAELAARVSMRIPDNTTGMTRLVGAYAASPLARFHEWFYSEEHDPVSRWPETYDRTSLEVLPACARIVLENPNDLLLRPSAMRLITRVFLSLGWHPRHIAGLIRSKFERDFGWGDQWLENDPGTRADFYTRIFAGLFAVGRDDLINFNCQSAKEESICLSSPCADNLDIFRKSALHRKVYEHLGHRPFHRLFLPAEHL